MNTRRKLLVAVSAVLLTTPLAALGQQQSKVARIGYLAGSSITDNAHYVQAFREGLHELGYVEERTLSSSTATRKATSTDCPILPPS